MAEITAKINSAGLPLLIVSKTNAKKTTIPKTIPAETARNRAIPKPVVRASNKNEPIFERSLRGKKIPLISFCIALSLYTATTLKLYLILTKLSNSMGYLRSKLSDIFN